MIEALPLFDSVASLFLVLLAAVSAIHKLSERERTLTATAGLIGMDGPAARLAWTAAVAAEFAAAALLLHPATRALGALLLLLLWANYTMALVLARRHRRLADCGCSFGRHDGPGRFELLRNAALLLLALWVSVATPDALDVAGWAMAGAGALAFLTLYLAADAIGGRLQSIGATR